MTPSYMCHDVFICVTWLIHTCALILFLCFCTMTPSYVCAMTHSYVCHPWFWSASRAWYYWYAWVPWLLHICVPWLIHMCAMTDSYVCHDSFICVTHDSFICVTHDWFICVRHDSFICVKHDSFICVTWLARAHVNTSFTCVPCIIDDALPERDANVVPVSHGTCVSESCHTYEWVMAHMWTSHVTHINESCHTCEWVMSHIWMSHVSHMDESCHKRRRYKVATISGLPRNTSLFRQSTLQKRPIFCKRDLYFWGAY